MVPKAPRTVTENLQKKESTFWKSYKVRPPFPAQQRSLTSSQPVSDFSQVLRAHYPSFLLPFVTTSLSRHERYSHSNLLSENEPRRQNHLEIQGNCEEW